MTQAKRNRVAAGLSQVQVAAQSGTSLGTVRAYELDPEAVTPPKRVKLDAIYATLESPAGVTSNRCGGATRLRRWRCPNDPERSAPETQGAFIHGRLVRRRHHPSRPGRPRPAHTELRARRPRDQVVVAGAGLVIALLPMLAPSQLRDWIPAETLRLLLFAIAIIMTRLAIFRAVRNARSPSRDHLIERIVTSSKDDR